MGCSVRDKHLRTNRKHRPLKSDSDASDKGSANKSSLNSVNFQLGLNESRNSNPNFEGSGFGYCTEEQLEDILMKNLEFMYNEAIVKLVELGYDEEVALRAVLRNGHCYGGMDVLTNILHNSLAFLSSRSNGNDGNEGGPYVNEHVFADLRELEEYSLACMVCLLQRLKPHLSKGDAMWCLLISDLHVGRASAMEIPVCSRSNGDSCNNGESSGPDSPVVENVENMDNDSVGVTPALCRFHEGWGFGNDGSADVPVNRVLSHAASEVSLEREIECPKRFDLSPSMKMLLKRNATMFAAGYRANTKDTQVGSSSLSNGLSSNAIETVAEKTDDTQSENNQEVVNMMLSKFRDLNIDGDMEYVPENQKDEMILSLMHQIKDLEKQVKERKEWAHQKAMQAAKKLCNDLTELKMLRMEREETQSLKQGKSTVEDRTMKRLSEMETALRKASGQVDRANAAVRRLETENAEIRAEMEAAKLSASESVNTCLEVARREKKHLKRLLAWEKQRVKLQDDIAAEKRKIIELQEEMIRVEAAKKAAEAKLKQQQKAKEHALAQVEEERRLKKATEANNKRKQEALLSKIELDFQRHKDDLQRLEQELARLKLSNNSDDNQSTYESAAEIPNGSHPTIARLLHELDNLDDFDEKESGIRRECIICLKDEVSVVFLPCAHQVVCATCNDEFGTKGKATCPICRVVIEQRIHVFGASS